MFSFTKHERLVILIVAAVLLFGNLAQFLFARVPAVKATVHVLRSLDKTQRVHPLIAPMNSPKLQRK